MLSRICISFFVIISFISVSYAAREREGTVNDDWINVDTKSIFLQINFADAGNSPEAVLDTGKYSIRAKGQRKIIGRLDSDMPDNTKMEIKLNAKKGAISCGFVQLSTYYKDLVTNIGSGKSDNRTLTFRFSATAKSQSFNVTNKTLILSIVSQ